MDERMQENLERTIIKLYGCLQYINRWGQFCRDQLEKHNIPEMESKEPIELFFGYDTEYPDSEPFVAIIFNYLKPESKKICLSYNQFILECCKILKKYKHGKQF